MTAPRFFCSAQLAPGGIVPLPDAAAHHAARVLRMKPGDAIVLFNGNGSDFFGEILRINKSEVVAKLERAIDAIPESPLAVTLAQGVSSGDRMDFTLQKAVELGVQAIQPIAAERSVVRLAGERADKRRDHWQNVVTSACEQSGRAVVPGVAPIATLTEWLGRQPAYALKLMLAPGALQRLHDLPRPQGAICLLVGCEGGFTETERAAAASCGFTEIRLGSRILRTETAAMAALAAMQTLWGDF